MHRSSFQPEVLQPVLIITKSMAGIALRQLRHRMLSVTAIMQGRCSLHGERIVTKLSFAAE
jgi:hypothetical protein